ncbi:MAG: VOC family protein [SAR324 cluster bacterium]|nr:VOC family protein [SAR324 cluster bacterium]
MNNPTPNRNSNDRPPVAIGHVSLLVSDVGTSTKYFVELGLRSIHESKKFTVLELRGGTHLILSPAKEKITPGAKAPFDLMVDDVKVARRKYEEHGMAPSAIANGRIHSSFTMIDPSGYEITITSSHAGERAV